MGRYLSLVVIGFWLAPAPAWAQDFYEALAATYETNPTLLARRAELRAVNEGVPQALSNYRPFVSIDGLAGTQSIDENGLGGSETTYPYEASIGLSQPLYRGGRTVADVARAEAEVQAQRAFLVSVEQGVLLDAVTAYMDVWRDEAILRLNINNEKVLARQLEASQDRFDVGELTRTDVAQSESRLARATAERIAAEGDLTSSRAVFLEVIGLPATTLAPPPTVEGLPTSESEAVLAALGNNPDLRNAEYAARAAEHQVRVDTGELLPVVSLSAELLHSENSFSDDSEIDRARVLAIVSIPLYQQGLVSSQVRESKQAANQRLIETEEVRRRIQQDTIDAWKDLVTAQAQIRSFLSETRSSEIALEGVRQENAVGARTILDILDAEQEFLDAQVNLVRAQRDEIVASFALLQTLGRLTADDLGLRVKFHDTEGEYQAVRDLWFGLDGPTE